MDKISDGHQRSTEMVWNKTEPTDIKSSAYFCIKSENENTVVVPSLTPIVTSTIDKESEAVSIKSEITLGEFECIPPSDVLQLTNDEIEDDVERKCIAEASVGRKLGRKIHQRTRKKSFSCSECGKEFSGRTDLARHLRTHTGEKPFACDKCDAKFTQKSSLQLHMKTQHNLVYCKECGEFIQKCHMESHKLTHIVYRKVEKLFACDECGKKFNSKSHLKYHLWRHFGEKGFVCDECGKTFVNRYALVGHLRFHSGEKPFACDVCGMKFARKNLITEHMRTHSGEKPYSCDVCGRKFSGKARLKYHKRTHTGEKPYSCDECEMKFATRTQKTSHKLTHTGEMAFACDECGMRFARKKQIKPHKLQHTGEKPFACDKCEMRFTTKFYLNSHKFKHTGEKPFACDECDKKFYLKAHLNQHKRVHNRKTKPEKMKENCKNKFDKIIPSSLQSTSNENVKPFLGNEFAGDGLKSKVDVKSGLEMHPGGNIDEKPFICGEIGFKFAGHNQDTVLIQPQSAENSFSCNSFEAQFVDALGIEMQQQINSSDQRPNKIKRNVRPRSVRKTIPCDDEKPFGCDEVKKAKKNHNTELIPPQKNAEKSTSCNEFEAQFVKALRIGMQQTHSNDKSGKKFKRNVRPRSVHKPIPCTDDKSFVCDEIGIKFHEKKEGTDLTQRQINGGPRPVNSLFSCDECEAKFATKEPFLRHKRNHKNKNRYVCEECGKGFTNKHSFNRHKNSHTGAKPFSCDVCELRFAYKCHIAAHMLTHTGEKPFLCDECPSKFARNWHIKQHKQHFHRKK